jgi:uncharacterized iron-regulated membrane protein
MLHPVPDTVKHLYRVERWARGQQLCNDHDFEAREANNKFAPRPDVASAITARPTSQISLLTVIASQPALLHFILETSMSSMSQEPPFVASSNRLYRAVWRWHFYSGLFVAPFMIMLAITGLLMLWFTSIAPEFGERMTLAKTGPALTINQQSEIAKANYPDAKIGQYIAPYTDDNPAVFRLDMPSGNRMVAVDHYAGKVVNDRLLDGTWNSFFTDIHGSLLLGGDGGLGDLLIEVAASLGIISLVTGLYLWFPQGRITAKTLIPQVALRGRAFWKSLHETLGFWISVVLLFFLLSGLAWTTVWGGKLVQAWSTFPAEKWDNVPISNVDHASMNHGATKEVPWALEQTPLPASGSAAGITGVPEGTPVVLESIVALGRAKGLEGRFQVSVPQDEKAVWTISQDSQSYDSATPMKDRTIHVDQYTGKILAEVGFADYSIGGKSMAIGIALHEGQLGWWNIALNAAFCLLVLLVAASGVVMWWKRRPTGSMSAPLYPKDYTVPKPAFVLGAALALAFPMGGLAILFFAIIDMSLPRHWKEAGM